MSENETVIYFDASTREGGLVEVAAGTPPEAISSSWQNYGELLLMDEFPYQRGKFEKMLARGVTRERCIELGQIAMKAMEQYAGERKPMTLTVLKRMLILGTGIECMAYFSPERFTGLRDFNDAIGSRMSRSQRGYFDDWTTLQFVKIAARIERQKGRPPKGEDFNAYAKATNNTTPTRHVILRRFGSIANLNEYLGHPNIDDWNADNYTNFGAKIVELNGADKLQRGAIDILSSRRRGPSYKKFQDVFGTWEKYKIKVLERVEERAETHRAKVLKYKAMIAAAEFPFMAISDELLIQYGAGYELAQYLLPHTKKSRLWFIAADVRTKRFFKEMIESDPELTAGQIELSAEELGLDEDIWPMEQF